MFIKYEVRSEEAEEKLENLDDDCRRRRKARDQPVISLQARSSRASDGRPVSSTSYSTPIAPDFRSGRKQEIEAWQQSETSCGNVSFRVPRTTLATSRVWLKTAREAKRQRRTSTAEKKDEHKGGVSGDERDCQRPAHALRVLSPIIVSEERPT